MGDITRNTYSQDTCVLALKQCKIQNHAIALLSYISSYIHIQPA